MPGGRVSGTGESSWQGGRALESVFAGENDGYGLFASFGVRKKAVPTAGPEA